MIPKQLYFLWFGENPPKTVQFAINAYKKINPTFKINFIYEPNIKTSTNPDIIKCYQLIYNKHSKYSRIFNGPYLKGTQHINEKTFNVAFSDAFRSFLLDTYGGIYVDCDTFPVKPFDDKLLSHKYFQCQAQWSVNGTPQPDMFFIGAEPNQDVYPGSMLLTYKNLSSPFLLPVDTVSQNLNLRKTLQKKFDNCTLTIGEAYDKKQYINHYFMKNERWTSALKISTNDVDKMNAIKLSTCTKTALILTIVRNQNNYGQRLQAYALEKFISDNFNIDVYTCDPRETTNGFEMFTAFENKYMNLWQTQNIRDLWSLNPDIIILGGDQTLNSTWSNLSQYGENILLKFPNIISYASSDGGISLQKKSSNQQKNIEYLKRFKSVSVREKTTADFLSKTLNKTIRNDIDPVFLIDYNEWIKLEQQPSFIDKNEEFDFTYIMSSSHKDCNFLTTSDGVKKYTCFGNTTSKNNLSINEFLWMIHHCKNFTTTSFHGISLALIYNRNQIKILNKSDNRIKQLLTSLNVKLINDSIQNLNEIKSNIRMMVNNSYDYFNNSFINDNNLVIDYTKCCGCMLCKTECSENAIKTIIKNGFKYPYIDVKKCIKCNKCHNTCSNVQSHIQPVINKTPNHIFLFQHKEKHIRQAATSGAFIRSFSTDFVNNGGIVYGVKFSKDFKSCYFSRATNANDVYEQCKSKYLESNDIPFKQIENDLKNNINVLFVGLPCQTHAIYKKFRLYQNLLIFTLICNSIPSQQLWKQYLQTIERKYKSQVIYVNMRYGLRDMYIVLLNGKVIRESPTDNEWLSKYISSNKLTRPSCFNCNFKYPNIYGDLIVGDAWGFQPTKYKFDDNKLNLIMPITQKGNDIILSMQKHNDFKIAMIDEHEYMPIIKKYNKSLFLSHGSF